MKQPEDLVCPRTCHYGCVLHIWKQGFKGSFISAPSCRSFTNEAINQKRSATQNVDFPETSAFPPSATWWGVCVCVRFQRSACMHVCVYTHTHTFVSKLTLHMLLRTHIHVKSVCVCVCFLRCVSRKGAVRRDDWRHFNTHTHTHNHTCYRTHTHTHPDTGWQVKAVTVKTEKSFS